MMVHLVLVYIVECVWLAAGWQTSIADVRHFADLPENAKKYLKFIETRTGLPIQWVGVGPARESTIQVF